MWSRHSFGSRIRNRSRPPFPEPIDVIDAEADPAVIRDAHLFVLDRLGRSMGLGLDPHPDLEPPSDDRIVVFGRFDPRASQKEFGLELMVKEAASVCRARVARIHDLYIPEGRRRPGFGTRLMADLVELWGRVGVVEARLSATTEGLPAYEAWGFVGDAARDRLDSSLQPLRLILGCGRVSTERSSF